MRRREFLAAPLAVGFASLVARLVSPSVPVLWGDGRHDDSAALEAALNGNDVTWSDGRLVGDTISNGHFLVRRTIHVRELRRSFVNNYIQAQA